jgi:hypothetical protein
MLKESSGFSFSLTAKELVEHIIEQQELAELLEEDANADKLRSLSMFV